MDVSGRVPLLQYWLQYATAESPLLPEGESELSIHSMRLPVCTHERVLGQVDVAIDVLGVTEPMPVIRPRPVGHCREAVLDGPRGHAMSDILPAWDVMNVV